MNESTDDCLKGVDLGDCFNFKCNFCHKNLSSRQNLKEHMNIHTGLKPYICKIEGCGQSFRQGSLLSIHKKIHAKPQKEKHLAKAEKKQMAYIKLTQMIKIEPRAESVKISKEELIEKIGSENFRFIQPYLDKLDR